MSEPARNVLGGPLATCSMEPRTGWFRDGCCRTDARDLGRHLVCAEVDDAFLAFTAAHGNDLSTPRPEHDFPGLVAGDRWCLCVHRWKEALAAGVAPRVVLRATHANALQVVSLEALLAHAADADVADAEA